LYHQSHLSKQDPPESALLFLALSIPAAGLKILLSPTMLQDRPMAH